MAIALVIVPPDEKSTLAKYTSFGLQRTTDYCSHHPSPPYFRRGVADDGDEPDLGLNKLISMLGEKSSSLLEFRLWKLQPDYNRINAHVSLLGCPSAIFREYRMSQKNGHPPCSYFSPHTEKTLESTIICWLGRPC
jgi:hypothetical protein